MSFGKVSKAVASVLVAVDAAAAAAAASSVAAIAEMESEVAVLAFLTGGSVASSTELTPAPDTCAASEGGAFSTDADAAAAAAAAAAAVTGVSHCRRRCRLRRRLCQVRKDEKSRVSQRESHESGEGVLAVGRT